MLSNTQKVLVQESFAAVLPIADDAAVLFYRRLFELDPSLEGPLRDLGAQHVALGAKPGDYVLVREALIRAIRGSSADWNDTVEVDWRRAITAIAVPMLEGAAVHTAMVAERLSKE